ncbi:hypothetical protein SY88_09030 [Clostridiales bacterium PH28_bin88]|nr:hypothetical protein SY88_09030 [Clostridiales bacterium PH28_bin88]
MSVTVTVEVDAGLIESPGYPNGLLTVSVPGGTDLSGLRDQLKLPETFGVALVNGKSQDHGYILQEGDRVDFLPRLGIADNEAAGILENVVQQLPQNKG